MQLLVAGFGRNRVALLGGFRCQVSTRTWSGQFERVGNYVKIPMVFMVFREPSVYISHFSGPVPIKIKNSKFQITNLK